MPTLYYTEYSNPAVTQQRVLASFLNLQLTLQHITKHAPLILVDGSLVLNQPHAISMHLAAQNKLLGNSFQDQIEVYSWLQYFNVQISPLITEIYGQIFGKIPSNQKKYIYAIEQLKRVLKVLDDKLKLRTFLVGDSLTLADISICSQLQTAFRLIITPEIRKKHINLVRWYVYVRNQKPFVECSGKLYLCENAFKIQFGQSHIKPAQENVQAHKQQQNKQKKTGQKQEKKKGQKKQQAKKPQKQQKPVKNQQVKTQETKTQQKQGQFNLDDFKRAYQNTEDKTTVIDQLFANFSQGWSIWKVYYSKDVTQGKVDYLTSNLAKGTLQRLENLRKTGFGYWGVYHSEQLQEYQIRGVMLWKGQDIAVAWKQHPSFEYHLFYKLNPKAPQDQKIIKDYWLQAQTCEGLKYYNSFKLI